jgi:hypothetical protein
VAFLFYRSALFSTDVAAGAPRTGWGERVKREPRSSASSGIGLRDFGFFTLYFLPRITRIIADSHRFAECICENPCEIRGIGASIIIPCCEASNVRLLPRISLTGRYFSLLRSPPFSYFTGTLAFALSNQ